MTDAANIKYITDLGLVIFAQCNTSLQFQFRLMDGKVKIWHKKKSSTRISITVLVYENNFLHVCLPKNRVVNNQLNFEIITPFNETMKWKSNAGEFKINTRR